MAQTPVRPWRVERQRYLCSDRWLTHRANRCVTERGEVVDPFHVFEFTDWVNVIALTQNNEVVMVKVIKGTMSVCLFNIMDKN